MRRPRICRDDRRTDGAGLRRAGLRGLLPAPGPADRHRLPAVRSADLRRVHEPGLGRVPVPALRRGRPAPACGAAGPGSGPASRPGGGVATKGVMVALAVVYVTNLVTRGLVVSVPARCGTRLVAAGELWRLADERPGLRRPARPRHEPARPLARRAGDRVRGRSGQVRGDLLRRHARRLDAVLPARPRTDGGHARGGVGRGGPAGGERHRQAQERRGRPRRHRAVRDPRALQPGGRLRAASAGSR